MAMRLRFKLDELISKITPENTHSEVGLGPAVGKEFSWEQVGHETDRWDRIELAN